jgi:integrase
LYRRGISQTSVDFVHQYRGKLLDGTANRHFVEWNGRAVASVKAGLAMGVRLVGLDPDAGNVTPRTLRHTAATIRRNIANAGARDQGIA